MPELVRFVTGSGSELAKDANKPILILPISVGEAYHSGIKFVEILKQANSHFSICFIIVADYLKRHTFSIKGYDEAQAQIEALQAGEEWIRFAEAEIQKLRAEDAESKLSMPIVFLRWQEILAHDTQNKNETLLWEYYESGQRLIKQQGSNHSRSTDEKKGCEIFTIINKAVGSFIGVLSRKPKGADKPEQPFDIDLAPEFSRKYVIEEAAAIPNFPLIINTKLGQYPHLKDRRMYMAYPVTNSPTNRMMFECVMQLGSTQNMELLDIRLNDGALAKLEKSPPSSPTRPKPASQRPFTMQPTSSSRQKANGHPNSFAQIHTGFFVGSINRSESPHTLIHTIEQKLTIEQKKLQEKQQQIFELQQKLSYFKGRLAGVKDDTGQAQIIQEMQTLEQEMATISNSTNTNAPQSMTLVK